MRKKFSTSILTLIAILLLSTSAFSAKDDSSLVSMDVKFSSPLKYAKPFTITAVGKIACRANTTLHIFDNQDGLHLIRGKSKVNGVYDNFHTTVCSTNVEIVIDKPGHYDLGFVMDCKDLEDTSLTKYIGQAMRREDFYVGDDSLVRTYDFYTINRIIQDSIDATQNEHDRKIYNRDSLFWAMRKARNLPPFTTSADLDEIIYQCGLLSCNIDDAIKGNKLFERNTSYFKQDRLLYAMPSIDSIENLLRKDYQVNIPANALAASVEIMKKQIIELYYFDQFIMHSDRPGLLARRKELLREQNEVRKLRTPFQVKDYFHDKLQREEEK